MKLYKVKKSNIDNKGLCANQDIKKGTKIIQYRGKIITRKKSEEDPKFDNDKAIYLFNLNKRYDLDGDFKYNTARLINHSCNPNCEVKGAGLKIWVYAIKDIKKNERLSKYNISTYRPKIGLDAKYYFNILGKKTKKNICKFSPIYLKNLK